MSRVYQPLPQPHRHGDSETDTGQTPLLAGTATPVTSIPAADRTTKAPPPQSTAGLQAARRAGLPGHAARLGGEAFQPIPGHRRGGGLRVRNPVGSVGGRGPVLGLALGSVGFTHGVCMLGQLVGDAICCHSTRGAGATGHDREAGRDGPDDPQRVGSGDVHRRAAPLELPGSASSGSPWRAWRRSLWPSGWHGGRTARSSLRACSSLRQRAAGSFALAWFG